MTDPLTALVDQQTTAFNSNAPEAERVVIYHMIQRAQKEMKERGK